MALGLEGDELGQDDTFASGDIPPMMQPLDIVLPLKEQVHDLKVVTRKLPEGQGVFQALHNSNLSKSLMSGCFESVSSSGGVTVYEGTFLNDPNHERPTPSGQGVRTNPDGSCYAGQWKDGYPDGHGEWKAPPPSCESYVGEWRRGKKHGFGLQKFANGDVYEGDWANGKFQDRGKYTYANGDEFMGIFQGGDKQEGTFYFKDGRISTRKWDRSVLVSCQDFDSRRRSYHPTHTKLQIHDPEKNVYGAKATNVMVSPRGVKID
mmetsp:Transcript_99976/g.214146  ORF Transcript_99976/g.214146 Transcript_99976/m.214146 type:complete len:263 (+) Transcript_99976:89-877(+)